MYIFHAHSYKRALFRRCQVENINQLYPFSFLKDSINPSSSSSSSLSLSLNPEENGDLFFHLSSALLHLPSSSLQLKTLPPYQKKKFLPFDLLQSFFLFSFMGAGVSSDLDAQKGNTNLQLKTGLNDVPESCISSIFMYLDPPEICKLARLNKAFRGASLADFVWETKLPSNYRYLVEKVLGRNPDSLCKKETFARLCSSNRFDGGNKEVWLDKNSGKLCLSVSAKAMKITGIDDRRYWNHIPTEESRFETVAYLQQIWWFEVVGELEFEFPPGSYSVFFRLHLGKPSKRFGRRVCNLDQVHGWNTKPVRFQLSTSTGHQISSECYLYEPGNWVHYHAGDFVIDDSNATTKIKFSMMQIDCTHTKGGLCVDSVFIYPSEFRQMRFK